MKCTATLSRCECGLDEHPADVAHECVDPDPKCGGSWLDHPTDPDHILVVRWPGNRPGGINFGDAPADPLPGKPVDEQRPVDNPLVDMYDMLLHGPFRAPRGSIKFFPPPERHTDD